MQKVIITGQERAEIVQVNTPKAKDNWAVVKVHAAPMCTEYKAWRAGQPNSFLGHEAAGEVVDVARAGAVKVGDRVVVMPQYPCGQCDLCESGNYIHCEHLVDVEGYTGTREGTATYAQYLIKPDWLLPKIPDDISYERGSLACCGLGPSYGAFELMGLVAGQTVLITGLGPVGLGAIVNARARGAKVIAVESFPWRVDRALQMGAAAVLHPRDPSNVSRIKELSKGLGVDCALDCSGTVAGQRLCIDAARRKGKVAFVGECHDELAIRISPDMIRKGLTLIGSWHYNLAHFNGIMQVIRTSPLIDLLVSHTMPMRDVEEAFRLQASGECGKVILRPWGE